MPPICSDDLEGARCVHGKARKRRRPGTLRKTYGVGLVNRFNPGQVVATPDALAALEASGESLFDGRTTAAERSVTSELQFQVLTDDV